MAVITMRDYAVGNPDPLERGMVKHYLKFFPWFEKLPIVGVNGFNSQWLVETRMGDVGSRSLNEAFNASGVGSFERRLAPMGIIGGTVEIERRYVEAGGRIDLAAWSMENKARGMGYYAANLVVNGSLASNPETFDGIQRLVTEAHARNTRQVISCGNLDLTTSTTRAQNGGQLRYFFNQGIQRVRSLSGGGPTMAIMSENMMTALVDSLAGSGQFRTDRDIFDRGITNWNGVDLYEAGWSDPIAGTQVISDTFDATATPPNVGTTSIFLIKAGEDDLALIRQGAMVKKPLGLDPTNGIWFRWLIEDMFGVRAKHDGCIVRLAHIDITV